MSFRKEFQDFILRGNVIDMSVGIIVGAAFTKLVDSAVKDILMPPLGLILGQVDFSNQFITLKDGPLAAGPYATLELAQKAGAATINIGTFINVLISLVIVGFAVFMLVKGLNALKRTMSAEEQAPAPTVRDCPFCLQGVPLQATRCPFCTSQLEPVTQEEAVPPATL